jgi:hypothetical protein
MIVCFVNPGLSLRSNPGLKLANAFGVNLNGAWSNFPDVRCIFSDCPIAREFS